MQLRDKIAIKVLPTLLKIMNDYGKKHNIIVEEAKVAKTAYAYADAMLDARKNKNKRCCGLPFFSKYSSGRAL